MGLVAVDKGVYVINNKHRLTQKKAMSFNNSKKLTVHLNIAFIQVTFPVLADSRFPQPYKQFIYIMTENGTTD